MGNSCDYGHFDHAHGVESPSAYVILFLLIKVVGPSHETEGHLFMKQRDYTVRELTPMF